MNVAVASEVGPEDCTPEDQFSFIVYLNLSPAGSEPVKVALSEIWAPECGIADGAVRPVSVK